MSPVADEPGSFLFKCCPSDTPEHLQIISKKQHWEKSSLKPEISWEDWNRSYMKHLYHHIYRGTERSKSRQMDLGIGI